MPILSMVKSSFGGKSFIAFVLIDPECYRLWNDLESSLSSAISYANDDIQFQLSLEPLRNEIFELRR